MSNAPRILARRSPSVANALVNLHAAISALLAVRLEPGVSVRIASRTLGIGSHLAWRLNAFRRAVEVDAMAASLPGRRGLLALLDAFANVEDAAPLLLEARSALATFERLAADEEVDVAGVVGAAVKASRDRLPSIEQIREEEFRQHRTLWPNCGHAKIAAWLVAPDRDQPHLGAATSLMLVHGLERTIPGPPLAVARPIMCDEEFRARLPGEADSDRLFGRQGSRFRR